MSSPGQPHAVVVGGGIAGLAAAFFLREAPCQVTVLEGATRPGGKLRVSEVAGVMVDEGAEALFARRPEGTGLAVAAGLADQLVRPGTTAAGIWSRGRMALLPRRQVLGVPADLAELAETGLVSGGGMARAWQDLRLPATGRDGDVPVAAFVAARFGQEVVDRLVDPLLAGVYAGRSEELSFEATLPALAAESRRHASLAEAASALLPEPAGPDAPPPVFTTLTDGLGTLPAAVRASPRTMVAVRTVAPEAAATAAGWGLTVGSAHAEEHVAADAVILAVPASPAARLLAGVPGASAAVTALREIRYASMAIVTLAYPAAAFPGPLPSSVKWPHLRDAGAGLVIVRCSLGRVGEEALLQSDDTELAVLAAADLAAATGARGAPVATRVTRWGGGLPQYDVGHLDRVARIRSTVAAQPGMAVCGAAYDGIGIPACVATARAAAAQIAAHLRDDRQ